MMDQKTWLWRKKSTEKIILAADKLNLSKKDNEEEVVKLRMFDYFNKKICLNLDIFLCFKFSDITKLIAEKKLSHHFY